MPYVTFKLDNFAAQFGVGEAHEGWRLRWQIELSDWLESVGLSNGEDLRELPGSLHLRPAVEAGEDSNIGALHFLEAYEGSSDGVVRPSPARYSVELLIPPATLRDLFDMEQQGKGPAEATISVPGLHYGSLPDGSDKLWELQEKRNWLAVDGLTFSFPSAEPEDDAEDIAEPDPTVEALRALTRKLDDLAQKFEKTAPWLLAGVGGALIAAIFR